MMARPLVAQQELLGDGVFAGVAVSGREHTARQSR